MVGEVLRDRYHLTAEIGRGAMGRVYRAHDSLLGRQVAVKVIPPSRLDATGRARFLREVRAAARLNHPNIVSIYDAGEEADRAYIVMELVEGSSLRSRLPLEREIALEIACDLCLALEHAHSRGIVHRDLKPENVLVAGSGIMSVKLTDFGLASACGATRLTEQGTVLGTLAYIAPEQASGEEVDGRADLYSLGILLYEMLTGRVPFEGSPQVVISQHLKAAPRPPRDLNVQIPAKIEEAVLRLLAKDRALRFPSAQALLGAIGDERRPSSAPATSASTTHRRRQTTTSKPPASATSRAQRSASATPPAQASATPRAIHEPAIPDAGSELIGRSAELRNVWSLIARDRARLVTLTGPGGSGKTRLALTALRELTPDFRGSVAFVPLAAVADPARVSSAIALALRLPDSAGVSFGRACAESIHGEAFFLVLDNFEQVLAAAPVVSEMLDACSGLQVLVTSREHLHLPDEREIVVPPLGLPDPMQASTAAEIFASPAVRLFVKRARQVVPDFDVTDANAPALARVCAQLDGLPLALELAACRINLLPPAAMVEQIARTPAGSAGSALGLLAGGLPDAPARQHTMRAAVEWSYVLLDDEEKRLFRELSIFAGTFTLEAAEAVCGGVAEDAPPILEMLASLIDKSLVRKDADALDEARFTILETIREYARERLATSGRIEEMSRKHLDYFVAFAERTGPELGGSGQARTLALLQRERNNISAALDWAISRMETTLALRIVVALRWFWTIGGTRTEARKWIDLALSQSGGERSRLHTQALQVAGALAEAQGEYRQARARFEQCLALSRDLGDNLNLARSLGSLGELATNEGKYAEARVHLAKALELWRGQEQKGGLGATLINLGMVSQCLGDSEAAVAFAEEALVIVRGEGNRHNESTALNSLAHIAFCRKEYDRAEELYEESLAIRRALNDAHCTGTSLTELARLALSRDDRAGAYEMLRESIPLLRRVGARSAIAAALVGLARLAAAEGRLGQSAALAGAAEALRETSGSALGPVESQEHEQLLEILRSSMDRRALRTEWIRGRTMDLDSALSEAFSRRL